jgi:putative PIN family toxin of toxin-antitoxin system
VLTLDAALDGRIELVTSPLLLQEIASALARARLQRYLSVEEATRSLADLAAQTVLLIDPEGPLPAVCRDPYDDYLVALATASGAEAIVIGDLDLLALDPGQLSFEILTPRELTYQLG